MEKPSRPAVRVLCVLIGVPLALVLAVWGLNAARAAHRTPCGSPGKVYGLKVLVQHPDKKMELRALFLVCTPKRFVKIVDSDGRSYESLGDFRAHNHLFTGSDKITLPGDFPAVNSSEKSGFKTFSGHTGNPVWWWLLGAAIVALLAGGGFLGLRALQRRALDSEFDAEAQEP